MSLMPFHLAIPVHDLPAARRFYGEVFGLSEGRSAEHWVDFDFFGHQLSVHLAEGDGEEARNAVDGDDVPVRHFGVILPWTDWVALHQRIAATGRDFLIPPRVRFEGQPGEQGTFFLRDPAGNALEFKSFQDLSRVFAR